MSLGIPILRLSLEGMKAQILTALSEYQVGWDEDVRAAVEAFCTPEHLREVINQHVSGALNAAIREEVEWYFKHGAGRKTVKAAVLAKFEEGSGGIS